LTAAFENFVVLKAKEKGINLSKDNIDSINDKQAFPN
jgi:GTP cyclohydrolase FolE2